MAVVVDDLLLARIVVAGDPVEVVGSGVVSTGYWWYRLCRAVLGGGSSGSLSSHFSGVDPETRRLLLTELPLDVEIHGMQTLAPLAAATAHEAAASDIRLNTLAAEAVAAVRSEGTALHVATHSPALADAARVFGFDYHLVR